MTTDAPSAGPGRPTALWGPLATALWAAAVMAVFVAVQVAAVAALTGFPPGVPDGGTVGLATLAASLPAAGLLVAAASRRARWRDYLALDRPAAATSLRWLVGFVLLLALVDLSTWALGQRVVPDAVLDLVTSARPRWPLALAVLVAAPVFEELVFRGFVWRGFAATRLGPLGAAGLAAGLWAVLHLQYGPYHVGVVVVYGLVLGIARWRTGSTTVAILLHAAANLVAWVQATVLIG